MENLDINTRSSNRTYLFSTRFTGELTFPLPTPPAATTFSFCFQEPPRLGWITLHRKQSQVGVEWIQTRRPPVFWFLPSLLFSLKLQRLLQLPVLSGTEPTRSFRPTSTAPQENKIVARNKQRLRKLPFPVTDYWAGRSLTRKGRTILWTEKNPSKAASRQQQQ